MQNRIPCFLALRLSVQRFQIPFEGLSPCENVGNVLELSTQIILFYKIWLQVFPRPNSLGANINICRQLMEDLLLGANGAPVQYHVVVERVNECGLALRSMAGRNAKDPRRWSKHATLKTVLLLVRVFKWVLYVRLTQHILDCVISSNVAVFVVQWC